MDKGSAKSNRTGTASVTAMDLHWLAGFMDGEGCFQFHKNRCVVQVVQKDAWPLLKAKAMVGGTIYRVKNSLNGRLYFQLNMTGKRAVGVMMTLYSLLSPRRQRKIADCITEWKAVLNRGTCNFKTHCKRGHPLNAETTFIQSNGKSRECSACSKIHKDNWYQRSKVTALAGQS